MNRRGYQNRRAFSSNNGEEETMVFDTSSPLLDHDEDIPESSDTTERAETAKPPEPRVYMAREVQQLLGIGKSKTYEYLEQVYQKQSPFRVIKVGRLYRVPKKSFDAWLDTVG